MVHETPDKASQGSGGAASFYLHGMFTAGTEGVLVLAGPAIVTAKLSETSIQGKDQLWSLSASWGEQTVGCWMEQPRLGCGRGWDRSHCHMPASGGCHHRWSEHQLWMLHASVSPEVNAPIAPGAPEMGFSQQVLHPKKQPSRGSLGPAQAESQPVPAAPDGQEN